MIFSKALALKAFGGLSVAAASATGIYFVNDHFQNQLSKFDRALIEHLNKDGAQIKFAVLGSDRSNKLTSFPSGFSSDNSETIKVKLVIKDNGTEATEGKITAATGASDRQVGTIEYLQDLNKGETNGEEWTWTCEIKLKREGNQGTDVKEKDKIWKNGESDNQSFLWKLTKEDNKAEKEKFIRNCAKERGAAANKEISSLTNLKTAKGSFVKSSSILESTKEFNLKAVTEGSDTKLVFKDDSEFKTWFTV